MPELHCQCQTLNRPFKDTAHILTTDATYFVGRKVYQADVA